MQTEVSAAVPVAVSLIPYRLPLKRPWVAASATLAERRGMLVRMTAADGRTGWGDCAPLPSSGEPGLAAAFSALRECARRVCDTGFFLDARHGPPEVRWAIETALLDLEAQGRDRPLAALLAGGHAASAVAVNAALGPLDEGCAARASEALAQGFAIGKIKVGVEDVEKELARLAEVVEATRGSLRLRLDANRAWDAAAAQRALGAIAPYPIDAVEEPLAAPTLGALAQLQALLPFALAIDESLPRWGADAVIGARAVRRLVLKPARIGGHAATLAIARRAMAAGMEVVLTSVVDSAVGVAATAHLAAAAAPSLAHGLATGAWLADDVAEAIPVVGGYMVLPAAGGLGVAPADPGPPLPP